MKKLIYIIVVAAMVFAIWWFQRKKDPIRQQAVEGNYSEVSATTSNATGQLEPAGTNQVENIPDQSNIASNKNQTVQGILRERNNKSLDLYGQVVDQYGQPVAGAKIRGSIGLYVSMVQSGGETCHTETDSLGRFNFIGIHGAGIGIWPQKEGYFFDLKLSSGRPDDYVPDPNAPLVFKMWKLRGAESLVSSSAEFAIPFDGTQIAFDLTAQKQDANGDMQIVMTRSPAQVKRTGQKFEWNLKIRMVRGGLIATNDLYPYWAPESGYVPAYQAHMSTNDVPWRSTLTQNFYIKTAQGQFGRLRINAFAALTPARIKLEFWVNPSGSQNLEFGLENQAR